MWILYDLGSYAISMLCYTREDNSENKFVSVSVLVEMLILIFKSDCQVY